jgi:hypothetical protein
MIKPKAFTPSCSTSFPTKEPTLTKIPTLISIVTICETFFLQKKVMFVTVQGKKGSCGPFISNYVEHGVSVNGIEGI